MTYKDSDRTEDKGWQSPKEKKPENYNVSIFRSFGCKGPGCKIVHELVVDCCGKKIKFLQRRFRAYELMVGLEFVNN